MSVNKAESMKVPAGKGTTKAAQPRSDGFMAVMSCLVYSGCSVSMVLANKALAFSYKADLEILMVVFQCLVAVVLVEGLRHTGYVQYNSFEFALAVKWLPVNLFFIGMLFSGFMSLKYMSVPMVTVFKNLTNVATVSGDWLLNGQRVSPLILLSLAIMVSGAVLAAADDITFSVAGYTWMTINCLATSGYVLYMKFATNNIQLPRFGMVFYNNLLTLILLTPVAFFKGEFTGLMERMDLHTSEYLMVNLFAGVVGFVLNFASLWCVGATSATTYAIVGSTNKVPTSVLGYFMFRTPISQQTLMYITVSITGGFMYSWAKIRESNADKRVAANKLQASKEASLEEGEKDPLVATKRLSVKN